MERCEQSPITRFRVVVVDDEPMAVRAIVRLIEKHCPDFGIAGTAENGAQALEVIRRERPDLVLTDIAMPVMNGLELASAASREFPSLGFVVISGYQDFAYMREAILNGVLDYISKPIVPSQITAMMERVEEKLRAAAYRQRNGLLRKICLGEQVEEELLCRSFPYSRYYAALLRENGLPRRFGQGGEPEVFGTAEEAYCVYGRDSREELFLIPEPFLEGESIESYMRRIRLHPKGEGCYTTVIYYGSAFPRDALVARVHALYHWLNALTTVGLNQTVNLDTREGQAPGVLIPETEELEGLLLELKGYARKKRFDLVQEAIGRAYDRWGREQRPQLWMEHASRGILNFIRTESGDETSLLESEYHLEDAFYYATSIQELRENLNHVFYRFREEEKEKPKVDSPEFFAGVEAYLQEHLAEPLSLKTLSDQFAISQTYMTKLFRKYGGESYARYLTELRISRAKQLMKENPGLYVRDVSELVGFRDQFYFSRIFRSYTGVSPAEYLHK